MVKFPSVETGRNRKLSQPWYGPFCVLSVDDPEITVQKVYKPQDGQIQIHQSRVTPCPPDLPPGYYWYGKRNCSPGKPPHWVEQLSINRQQSSELLLNGAKDDRCGEDALDTEEQEEHCLTQRQSDGVSGDNLEGCQITHSPVQAQVAPELTSDSVTTEQFEDATVKWRKHCQDENLPT